MKPYNNYVHGELYKVSMGSTLTIRPQQVHGHQGGIQL